MAKQKENLPMKKNKPEGLSRRDFFKIGAASAAVGAAGATSIPQKAAAKKLDEEVKKKLIAEKKAKKEKVEAKLTCTNCGSEADMWIDL